MRFSENYRLTSERGNKQLPNGESSYRRFLTGDDNGIVEIVRDYKDGLMLYLNSFVRNLTVAEELCEDTFVKLAVRRPHFRENSSFKTFLYTIGRNTAIDYLRKTHGNVIAIEELSDTLNDDRESLEQSYIREERKIAVHRAMETLKSEYQQVLWLTYFEELSNKETAAVMKKSVHNIETLVYRARNALKTALEKEGFEYEEL